MCCKQFCFSCVCVANVWSISGLCVAIKYLSFVSGFCAKKCLIKILVFFSIFHFRSIWFIFLAMTLCSICYFRLGDSLISLLHYYKLSVKHNTKFNGFICAYTTDNRLDLADL